jgi:hypothetical protein
MPRGRRPGRPEDHSSGGWRVQWPSRESVVGTIGSNKQSPPSSRPETSNEKGPTGFVISSTPSSRSARGTGKQALAYRLQTGSVMRSLLQTLAFSVVLLAAGSALHAQVSVDVRIGEPAPPRAYHVPRRPGPDYLWVDGYGIRGMHYRGDAGRRRMRACALSFQPHRWTYYAGRWGHHGHVDHETTGIETKEGRTSRSPQRSRRPPPRPVANV